MENRELLLKRHYRKERFEGTHQPLSREPASILSTPPYVPKFIHNTFSAPKSGLVTRFNSGQSSEKKKPHLLMRAIAFPLALTALAPGVTMVEWGGRGAVTGISMITTHGNLTAAIIGTATSIHMWTFLLGGLALTGAGAYLLRFSLQKKNRK